MAYPELVDYNVSDVAGVIGYSADVVPILIPLILFGIFMILLLGSYFAQKRSLGRGNFAGSFAVASWVTAIISVVFSLIPNLIPRGIVVFCIGLAILGSIWLWTSRMDE